MDVHMIQFSHYVKIVMTNLGEGIDLFNGFIYYDKVDEDRRRFELKYIPLKDCLEKEVLNNYKMVFHKYLQQKAYLRQAFTIIKML
ncbi:hypothetical protein TRFO_07911 [Tritrichomonas foetus]|uniref:Uncharacterized protein n=1 Tax=Tritrichomonas foetus TaxID=1144522 RepID=A0A1J4JTH3_9EUKA|nr:hypothetical protein TRFO_07911 [Tritrichomonas foetus]|eukprot:OHT00573.1 hypothetical protein TRFO_07911 [Tritrichomonas foetus]